jgi:putative SOS response-associated peptidase YedK
MCGRFALKGPAQALESVFETRWQGPFAERFNIAPGAPVLAVRHYGPPAGEGREFAHLRWGFVPAWQKDERDLMSLHNARLETALEKPSFKHAFSRRRCLVPASGYYDWDAKKNAFFVRPLDGGYLAMAGIWEYWQGANGSELESVAVLTQAAPIGQLHVFKRMPLCLPATLWQKWLSPQLNGAEVLALIKSEAPAPAVELVRVSQKVNDPTAQGADLIAPLLA